MIAAARLSGQPVMPALRRVMAARLPDELRAAPEPDRSLIDIALSFCAARCAAHSVCGACPQCGHDTLYALKTDRSENLQVLHLSQAINWTTDPVARIVPRPGERLSRQTQALRALWELEWEDPPELWTWVHCNQCAHSGWHSGWLPGFIDIARPRGARRARGRGRTA